MTAPTLIRTRRRSGRQRPEPAREVIERVTAGLADNDPPMLVVADDGRGWWPVAVTSEEVTVRRHGETLTVPWSQVALDE